MTKLGSEKKQLLKEIEQLSSELTEALQKKEDRTVQLFISEERFALAMRTANDGLWDWDLNTDEVYYSPRWKSMLGYKEHELEGSFSTWAALVHDDDKEAVLQQVNQYVSNETDSFEVEMRMHHKNGHEIHVRSRGFKVLRGSSGEVVRLIGTHVDITSQKKAELFDQKHTNVLEMIAKGNPAAEVYKEIALLYEERNPGMRCSMLELSGNKLLHGGAPSLPKAYCDAVHGLEYGPDIGSCGTSTFTGKRVLVENIETDPKWKNLKEVALPFGMRSCWSEPIKSSSGKVLGAFGMYYDYPALPNDEELRDLISAARLAGIVMEREQNQKRIRDLAYTDKLTKLSSRSHFYLNIEELIKISSRDNNKFGLLYIDLDNFKDVNDTLGHDVGDLLLKKVAQRLKKACREVDYIARLGGDEFCIAVSDVKGDYGGAYVAQRCLELISKTVELCGRVFTPACSIGIAYYPDDGSDLKTLLKAADTALYTAKDFGKNRYAFYKKELTLKTEYRFKVEQYLREAIEKEQLSLVYQPKIDIRSGKVVSVEALCRWNHPVLGHVAPVDFIRMAEEIGMIKPLTEWVLKKACQEIMAWKKAGLPSVRMAINISPSHFLDSDLVPLIRSIIEETSVSPSELELEVTEGEVQTNQNNLTVFRHLKTLGVYLAIDDFGIGYSSFASLKHLNVDFLKIDKHFIDDMVSDDKTKLLVGSMIEMGHNLGHTITAEGIESKQQLNILKELGCDTAQGYLFSKPVESAQVLKFLSNGNSHLH
ncbi:bifunctional diguanylate cyclase/phosphodiesterase [Thalassotalea atypica]|uniref:bifunctional diguanylate cyclase/phosphodiesterase n=1 Tax=Thalassotalea atypica TaxID=2054316 RepID=UPI002573BBE7|nr:EAL domain-containing protein [Thalassotalea atypica]